MSKSKLAVMFLVLATLCAPVKAGESLDQSCFGAAVTKKDGKASVGEKPDHFAWIVREGLKSAAVAQMKGNKINAALPTYQPLDWVRAVKRNLDVYVNPTVSIETRAARFVGAKAVAHVLEASGINSDAAVDRWTDSGVVIGVMIDDAVIGVTPEFAERLDVDYRDLMEGVMKGVENPATYNECFNDYGYIFAEEESFFGDGEISKILNDAPPFITWGYRSNALPENLVHKLTD